MKIKFGSCSKNSINQMLDLINSTILTHIKKIPTNETIEIDLEIRKQHKRHCRKERKMR